jgi:hypothetical protein
MREESLSLRGAHVRALPRRNRTWSQSRVCAQDGCITTISIYNKSKYCWAHEPLRYYIARGRKKRPEAA